jgi:hypothetical protein
MKKACRTGAPEHATLSVAADRLLSIRKCMLRSVPQFDESPAKAAYLKSP